LADRLVAVPGGRELLRFYSFRRSRLHVVSYPKSGRTWLRFSLGLALTEHFGLKVASAGDLLEINRLARIDHRVPSIKFSHDDNPHMKEISQLERDKHRYRSRDVVFLARDPRDVVVSSYYQHTRRAPHFGEPGFEGKMSVFIRHPVFGIETVVEFMNIWAANRNVPRRFHLVRYEDMSKDPSRELMNVLRFAGIEQPEPSAVRQAVEAGRFEQMQALERSDSLDTDRLRPTDEADSDSFKARRGIVGVYEDELAPKDREFVDQAIVRLDRFFGYGSPAC
jgi:hypothetical protein